MGSDPSCAGIRITTGKIGLTKLFGICSANFQLFSGFFQVFSRRLRLIIAVVTDRRTDMKPRSASHIFSALAAGILISLSGCGSPQAGATASPNTPDLVVDANQLVAAFEKNAEQAAENYTGKTARISGYFARLETLDDGRAAIVFKTSIDTYRSLRCVNRAAELASRIAELDAGSPMTVDGKIGGFTDSSYFVTVDECFVR